MKKILVLDLDGTSITDTYKVTDELQQIVSIIKKNHMVYIATGRSVSDAYPYYKLLGLEDYIICHNGGLVYEPKTGAIKYKKNIACAKEILNFLQQCQNVYGIDNVVLSKCNETYLLTNKNKYLHKIIINEDLPFSYLGKQVFQMCDIQRIIISCNPKYCHSLQDKIMQLFNNVIVCGWRGCNNIIDISVGNVNKWEAVFHIAKENNILAQNIISFGDALNDIELLKNSGVGVCMLNGEKETKKAADFITDYDNNDNGVYDFLINRLAATFDIT